MANVRVTSVKNSYRAVVGRPVTITICQHNSPLVSLHIFRIDDDQEVIYDLYGTVALWFYVKADPSAADGEPLYVYPGAISLVDPAAGTVAVQFDGSLHPTSGNWFFRLDCQKFQTVILAHGRLHVSR